MCRLYGKMNREQDTLRGVTNVDLLSISPIVLHAQLAIFDSSLPTIVATDALDYGLGAILQQDWRKGPKGSRPFLLHQGH